LSVVWTGTYFVAAAYDIIIRSTDGITWEVLVGITQTQQLQNLATNGSKIIATPLSGVSPVYPTMYISNSDGGSFTPINISQIPGDRLIDYNDILWDGSKFIVTISDITDPLSNPSSPPLTFSKLYSADGLTWTPISNVGYTFGQNIGFKGPSLYITRGTGPNSTERSTDGINWVTISDPILDGFPFNINGKGTIFSSQNYIFICSVSNDQFIYSTDGLSWNASSVNLPVKFTSGFSRKSLPS
jgi:hypothetical protein